MMKNSKESYAMQLLKKTNKRPTWFIGSEEEFLRACESKKLAITDSEHLKKCPKTTYNLSSTVGVSQIVTQLAVSKLNNHVDLQCDSTDAQVNKTVALGKHKKVVEPSITPVCTPVSDCDDLYKNNHILPAPSVERLLPIGSIRSPDSPRDILFPQNVESQLEIPSQERLLPIGQHNKDISQFVDKVRQALGINNQVPNDNVDQGFFKKEETHQSHSPRRLIKQVALESPPNQQDTDTSLLLYKAMKIDNHSKLISPILRLEVYRSF